MRKKLQSRLGEMLVESLISMVIISLTGMMLAMAAASAMRGEGQAARTTTFLNTSSDTITTYPVENSSFSVTLGNISLGQVTVKQAKKPNSTDEGEGLYYYEAYTPSGG